MTFSSEVPQLGPDWVPGPDGIPFRRGARVILFDENDRVLLARGHDAHQPDRTWWYLVGGGIDPGETAANAAVRELYEEAGLQLAASELVGPVFERSATFHFLRQIVRQDEVIFLARINAPGVLDTSGWTEIERNFMDELRWWPLDELRDADLVVYPTELVNLVSGLVGGWDGVLRQLGDDSQPDD
ncbi:MAG TPA: NUDIX domain-containing protein [Actinomycetales bacterium]|nr:NUDIX domain-containing protein [Actinomycetales bacterium]